MGPNDVKRIAASAVLQTPELLELILLHLPVLDLLLVQRASKIFATVIHDSISIQRRLFFVPTSDRILINKPSTVNFTTTDSSKMKTTSGPTDPDELHAEDGTMLELNPLLHRVWPVPSAAVTRSKPWNQVVIVSVMSLGIQRGRWQNLQISIPTRGTPGTSQARVAKKVREALAYEGASWRRMLLVQPPIFDPWCQHYCASPVGEIYNEDGVRLQDVADWEKKNAKDEENDYAFLTLKIGELILATGAESA